ncbi:MAG: 2-isopropylmalate synthase [Candidatus Marinimicrobia bacterium]|nr:2-isopropylmalate synthase [Candidatus Neomarinimicrobiota bacterium]
MLTNRKIEILDSTLREGEQTPGVSFTLDQKVALAKRLDAFGVDFIELGHPAVSPDVYEAVDVLNGLELNAKKMAHGRAAKSDINDAAAIGVPWLGIFFGTSPISLKHKFNVDRKAALQRIETAVKYGKDKGLRLRFTAEDASRTDIDFLIQVGELVQSCGADRFSLADTVGCLTPTKTKALVGRIVKEVDMPVHVHCHNDFGMATANALSALEDGAQCADVAVNGLGERCGLPPLAEIISALVNIYKVNGNWELGLIPGLTELVTSFSTLDAKANQPVVGKNAFSHKAGLHVKAVVKDPRSYEAMSPESFNRERKLVIDKYTGRAAIENKFESLGITLKKSDVNSLLKLIKSKPEKVEWTDNELISHAKSFGIEV